MARSARRPRASARRRRAERRESRARSGAQPDACPYRCSIASPFDRFATCPFDRSATCPFDRPAACPFDLSAARSARYSASLAASTARMRSAPSSGVSFPFTTYIPSSSGKMERRRRSYRSRSRAASSCRSPRFHARTTRSSWAVVHPRASSRSSLSFSPSATRVRARTFEKLSSPRAIEALVSGSSVSARAARTFSRAAPRWMPVRKESQCAHVRCPLSSQPRRRSKSAIRTRRR